jgi:hypothetical protein
MVSSLQTRPSLKTLGQTLIQIGPIAAFAVLSLLSAPSAQALPPVPNSNAPLAVPAQETEGFGKLNPAPPTGMSKDEIIQKFGARESAFNKALNEYTFRRTVKVETLTEDTNKIDGVYQDVTDIVLSDNGGRSEHVVFAPQNTLERVMMTQSDFDDIAHRLPFVLTTEDLPKYDLVYVGRQHVDDLDTYVFEASPKTLVKNQRYFQGRIWVDQKDLQIVLINGKTVPQDMRRGHEDLSPPYTTYYSEVDGGYWFPVYTHAEGNLHFAAANGALAQDVHIRYTVKYADYKRFHAKSRIIYNGEALPPGDSKQDPSKPADPAEKTTTEPTVQPAADPNAPSLKRTKPPQ